MTLNLQQREVFVHGGEEFMGMAGGVADVVNLTLSLDTNAYADGDVLAATQELENAMRVNGGTAILHSLVVIDKDDQAKALDVIVFGANVSLGTENSAVSIADADVVQVLGVVEVAVDDYVDLVNSQVAVKTNLGMVIKAFSDGSSLWVAVVSRGAGTYTGSGIVLRFGFLQD